MATSPPQAPTGSAPRQAPDESDFPFWRSNLHVLFGCNILSNIGFTLYFPFIPLILRELGVETNLEAWTGYYSAVLYAATTALMPVWGSLADHYGKRSMMLRATIGQCLGFAALTFVPDRYSLLALVAWIGVSNGFVASSLALVATNTPTAVLGRTLSGVQTGALIGGTLGPVLGGLLAGVLPAYRWLYAVGSGLAAITSTAILVSVREVHTRSAQRLRLRLWQDLRRCLAVPTMAALYYLMFLFSSTYFGSITIVSLYVLELLAGAESYLGLGRELWLSAATVSLTLASAAALPLWGRVLDRFEPRRVTLVALALCLLAVLPYLIVSNPLQLVAVRLVLGAAAVGLQPALLRLVRDAAPPGMEARALAFGTSLHMAGHGVAPLMAGLLAPRIGLRGYFACHALLVASGVALWAVVGVRRAER